MKFPTVSEMAKEVADKVYNEFAFEGKTLKEWVYEIKDYYEKKEQGKIIELPCNPGDFVYVLRHSWHGWEIDKKKFTYAMIGKIGKTVYLTKQEAQEALENLKENL